MSWYGKHPVISKAEAKAKLPLGACKRCVYFTRCFPAMNMKPRLLCSRCSTFDGVWCTMDFYAVPIPEPRRERLKLKMKALGYE